MLVITATWEVKMRKIMVRDQPKQKHSKIPISTEKLGMVAHTWDSYKEGQPAQKMGNPT
jgi:hypothetical protein